MGCIGRVGYKGHAVFGQKLLNTQWIGRCAGKLPIMKWANAFERLLNKSLKPNAASHTTTSCCTDTDGFLEHSPRKGSLYYKVPALQKVILVFRGPPSYTI